MVPITLYHHKLNSTLLTTVMSSKSYPKAVVVILSLENSECPWGITCLTGIQEPHNYACHTKKVCKFPMLTSNYYIISKSQKLANKQIIQWISVVFQWDSKNRVIPSASVSIFLRVGLRDQQCLTFFLFFFFSFSPYILYRGYYQVAQRYQWQEQYLTRT